MAEKSSLDARTIKLTAALQCIIDLIDSHRPYWEDEVTNEIYDMAQDALKEGEPDA